MIIRSVHLRNILSHKDTFIEFKPGLTAIRGPNGSGKSTIIDSILYCLLAGPQHRGEEVSRTSRRENMIRYDSSSGSITLVFEHGSRVYGIERRIYRQHTPSFAELYEILDGGRKRVLAREVRSVVDAVYRILGVRDPKALTATIASRQDMLDEFLLMSEAQRREKILEIVGLERLEKARERVARARDRVRLVIEGLRRDKAEADRLRSRVASMEREYSDLVSRLEDLRRRHGTRSRDLEKLKDALRRYEEARAVIAEVRELRRLASEIRELESELRGVEDRLSRLSAVSSLRGDIERLIKDYSKALSCERRASSAGSELSRINSRLRMFMGRVRGIVEDLGLDIDLDAEGDVERVKMLVESKISERINDLRTELGKVEATISTLKSFIESKLVFDECPICGRRLGRDEAEHIIQHNRSRIEEMERKLRAIRSELSRSEQYLSIVRGFSIERYIDALDRLRKEVDESRSCVEDYLSMCRELLDRLDRSLIGGGIDLDGAGGIDSVSLCPVSAFEGLLRELDRLLERKGFIADRLDTLKRSFNESRLRELEESLRSLIGDVDIDSFEQRYRDLLSKIEGVELEVRRLESDIGRLEGEIGRVRAQIDEMKRDLERYLDRVSKMPLYEKAYVVLERLADRVLGKDGLIARELISKLVSNLNDAVNSILYRLGRDFRVAIDEDFHLSIVIGGASYDLRNLSGGEKTILAIAFRLALARVVMGRVPSILILDEPTQNLDEENKRMIFNAIKEVSGRLDQVIVVTHDEEVEDIADHVLYVYKVGDQSRVEYVR